MSISAPHPSLRCLAKCTHAFHDCMYTALMHSMNACTHCIPTWDPPWLNVWGQEFVAQKEAPLSIPLTLSCLLCALIRLVAIQARFNWPVMVQLIAGL